MAPQAWSCSCGVDRGKSVRQTANLRMLLLCVSEYDRYVTVLAGSWSSRVVQAHDSEQNAAPAGLQMVSSGEIRLPL
jgi:hypothetical protein